MLRGRGIKLIYLRKMKLPGVRGNGNGRWWTKLLKLINLPDSKCRVKTRKLFNMVTE